jgi:DNA-binding IclR family transcriptional regulator
MLSRRRACGDASVGGVSVPGSVVPLPSLADDATDGRVRTYSAPALEKGFDILELLTAQPDGLTIKEMAQRLDRTVSEVFRIIVVMEQRRWLRKDPQTDRYTVTYHVLDVAFRATPAHQLTLLAAPAMHDLALAVNQSCHLVVRGGTRGLVGFGMRLGASVDLVTSCSGHVLLAFSSEERRETLLDRLPYPETITREQLRDRLEVVRLQGYEMQPSARASGVTDVSYPVFGFDGDVAAALTIPFLVMIDGSQRMSVVETRHRLREAARAISLGLGGSD